MFISFFAVSTLTRVNVPLFIGLTRKILESVIKHSCNLEELV